MMTEEADEYYRINFFCRFSEKEILSDKVRDHCHLTGKNRGPELYKCNENVLHKQSIFASFFFLISKILIVVYSLKT